MRMIEKIKRKNSLSQFGFGADVMKITTVCTKCNSMESTSKLFCSKCGKKLPKVTLYDYYRAQHRSCRDCGAILSESMEYCPKCGVVIKKAE